MNPSTVYAIYQQGIDSSTGKHNDESAHPSPPYQEDTPEYVIWLLGYDHGLTCQVKRDLKKQLLQEKRAAKALRQLKAALDGESNKEAPAEKVK